MTVVLPDSQLLEEGNSLKQLVREGVLAGFLEGERAEASVQAAHMEVDSSPSPSVAFVVGAFGDRMHSVEDMRESVGDTRHSAVDTTDSVVFARVVVQVVEEVRAAARPSACVEEASCRDTVPSVRTSPGASGDTACLAEAGRASLAAFPFPVGGTASASGTSLSGMEGAADRAASAGWSGTCSRRGRA